MIDCPTCARFNFCQISRLARELCTAVYPDDTPEDAVKRVEFMEKMFSECRNYITEVPPPTAADIYKKKINIVGEQ